MEPELPDLDMTLNAMSHMNLFDTESPIGGFSSGHGNNVLSPTSREDMEPYSGMNEDIFDDM